MHTDLGPFFSPAKPQPHPDRKVHDLGIQLQWGRPQHTARLYRNIRDYAPQIFDFGCVVIHEEDARGSFEYQAFMARKTRVGTFYPLTAYIQALYVGGALNRNIFAALAELERLMPPERHVTEKEILDFCRSLGKAKPRPPEPQPEPPTGLLAEHLEAQGFRLTRDAALDGRGMLNISWLSRPGGHLFFVGILALRPTGGGIAGQWRLPGPCGVNHLLREEFEQMCNGLMACLSPEGHRRCLAGIAGLAVRANGGQNALMLGQLSPFTQHRLRQAHRVPHGPSRRRSELC